MDKLKEARTLLATAEARMNEAADAVLAADDEISAEDLETLNTAFDEAESEVGRRKAEVGRLERIAKARETTTPLVADEKIEVISEPATYRKDDGSRSWFADLAQARMFGNSTAGERLARGAREALDEAKKKGLSMEGRALNSTDSSGGDFVPPIWVTDEFIALARPHRVFADLCTPMPLPPYGDSINVPSVTGGGSTAAQADNASVSNTDPTTGAMSAAVITIAGYVDSSRQAVERSAPGLDRVILADLSADYAQRLDVECLNGAGSGGHAAGVLQDANRVSLTYTDSTPTVEELWPYFAQANSQVASSRFLAPSAIVMHPRRWFWMTGAIGSTSGNPMVLPSSQGPYNAFGVVDRVAAEAVVGQIGGVPVYLDPNLPTTNGSSTNQDPILVTRASDNLLYEDSAGPRQFTFEGVLSANNEIRFQVVGYAAFGIRYSKSNASIDGTGLAAPSGY